MPSFGSLLLNEIMQGSHSWNSISPSAAAVSSTSPFTSAPNIPFASGDRPSGSGSVTMPVRR